MAIIDLNYASESEFRSKFAATPADYVAAGNSYRMLAANSEIVFANPVTLEGKVTGPDNYLEIVCQAGASYMDNSGILTNPLAYDGTKGAAAAIAVGFIPALFSVKMPYVKFTGYQMRQAVGNAGPVIKVFAGAGNVTLDRCILDGFGNSQFDWPLEINDNNFTAVSSLIVHNSNQAVAAYVNTKTAKFENVTFIRPSNFTKGGFAVRLTNDGGTFDNCAFFGFDALIENPGGETVVRNCGGSGTIPTGTGNLPNLVAADNLVNPASDYRLKAGSALINAGRTPSSNNTRAPNGIRQQGTAADIGAWETPDALVAPSATVTAVSVTGQNVTISGTTTGVPTSGTASVSPSSIAYNSAEAAGPSAITFGSGTFTVTFTGLKVGEYNFQFQVANSGYTVGGQNPLGAFRIAGAAATLTQDSMSGQVLRISGTVSGSPTSGQLIVPAATTNPNGAFDQTKAFTITGSTCEVLITLPPGNYDAGIPRFTNAAGTSLPQSGTSAVSVVGIDGNPQAPDDTPAPADTTAPTMNGAITVSAQTTSGFTLSWPAATDFVGVAYYEVDNGSGAYVNVGNVLTLAVTGKSSATTYQTRVRALDAAGNASSPLTASATTAAVTPAPDTTPPVFTGTVNVANTTATTATISWSAASDNVAVTGYEYSIDGGTVYVNAGTARTASLAGLNPSTIYSLRVRAYDSAGNRSSAITGSFETESATTPPTGFTPSISRTVRILAGRSVFDAGTFWTVSGNNSPVGSKDPNSTIDIHFDWTSWLEDIGGAELSAVDFILSPELVSVAGVPSETGGTVFVSGGSTGQNMSITCRITTATTPPRIEDRTVVLQIKEQ